MNTKKVLKDSALSLLVISITAGTYAAITTNLPNVISWDALDATSWNNVVDTVNNNTSNLGNLNFSSWNVGIWKAPVDSGSFSRVLDMEWPNWSATYYRKNWDTWYFAVWQWNSNQTYLWNEGNWPMRFATNDSEAMRIDSTGNVWIWTTSPSYKLDVNWSTNISKDTWAYAGWIKAYRDTYFWYSNSYRVLQIWESWSNRAISLGVDLTSNPSGLFSWQEIVIPNNKAIIAPNWSNNWYVWVLAVDSSNKLHLGWAYNLQTGWKIIIDWSNVWIWTTSPTHSLHVKSWTNPALLIENDTSWAWMTVNPWNAWSKEWDFWANNLWAHIYSRTDSAYRLTVNNNGNVWIWTTTPSEKLEVNGNLKVNWKFIPKSVYRGNLPNWWWSSWEWLLWHDFANADSYTSFPFVASMQSLWHYTLFWTVYKWYNSYFLVIHTKWVWINARMTWSVLQLQQSSWANQTTSAWELYINQWYTY
jgi:hypothetical protein